MKITLSWLERYCSSGLSTRDLAEKLTMSGTEVEDVQEVGNDAVLTLEVTSNRPDCLGHIGVARELAAAMGLELKLPDLAAVPTGAVAAGELTSVAVEAPDLCPRYTARIIRSVKVGPSPAWMVERLEAVGLRSINNIVDVTNYVLLEYSQPLHAFDQSLLAEGRIVVRRARDGEEIVSIDGTRCELTGEMLVITDAAKPVAVAGIMGGLESEVGDATTTILLESAQFDPLATRRAARGLSLMSESSFRFERGVDPVGVDAASLRACQLILQTAGGELASGLVDVWAKPFKPAKVRLRTARCRKLLGLDVDDATQADILARLGLSPKAGRGRITCTIPSHRADLTREVDLIEEVARLHGYEKIPAGGQVTHAVTGLSAEQQARHELREVLASAGFDEAISYSFIDDAEAELVGFDAAVRVDRNVRKTNNLLRPSLLPSLLRVCKANQDAGNEDVSLYELAAVYPPAEQPDALADEHVSLGMVTQRELRLLRGVLEAAVRRVAPGAKLEMVPGSAAALAKGAAAEVRLDGEPAGTMGMVAAAALDYYGLEKPCAAASIRFDMLSARAGAGRTYRPLPRFPAVRRDLSVVVDAATAWGQVAEAIASVAQPAREAVEYVGSYRGRQLPDGSKSVTFTLVYRYDQGTLRREEVDEMVAAVVAALGEKLSGRLRE